ncbi:5-hydroxytryptamine receptor 1B-like [Xenia sp. Carnegie-2017]|uniref:5-hydroxytryptamine receptor 1B-like n=1 Tax=Xenia sp. Carnegie-2017 TaxID=2897299 RepID=UPI001F04F523|nr:5-hydroxytryptamine receptor 1B-like [Xenia sp. Carnegie-2017]
MPESNGNASNFNFTASVSLEHAIIYKTAFILLSIGITVNNGIVLLLYQNNPRMQSTRNIFLASLAFSDLLAGIVVIPVTMNCYAVSDLNVCTASGVLFRLLAFSTILHILGIMYEKYMSIIHPFYLLEKKSLRFASGCIWSTSTIVALVPLLWLPFIPPKDPDIDKKDFLYFLIAFVVLFLAPLVAIFYAQVRMYQEISSSFNARLSQSSNQTTNENAHLTSIDSESSKKSNTYKAQDDGHVKMAIFQNRRVLKAFALMLGSFIMCWLVWYLGIFLHLKFPDISKRISNDTNHMLQLLVFLPPLTNPILYSYYKQDFRVALRSFLKRARKGACS